MDQEPLVNERVEAGWAFLREYSEYKPVEVAFWGESNEDGHWRLYVASAQNLPTSLRADYGEVHRLLSRATYYLDPFDVRLIHAGDPSAAAAREILHAYPARLGADLDIGTGAPLGISSDRVRFQVPCLARTYIYKPVLTVTTP